MHLRHANPSQPLIRHDAEEVMRLRDQLRQLQSALSSHTEESESRFRELVERVQTGVYRVSGAGQLILANNALLGIFGLPAMDFAGKSARSDLEGFCATCGEWAALLKEIEQAGEIRTREKSYRRRDGSVVYVRESARAVHDREGRTLYYEGVIEDMTPLRRSETLGRDSHRILHSLGENRPVEEILGAVAGMVARQWAGSASLIYRSGPDGPFAAAECNLPQAGRDSLVHWAPALSEPSVTGKISISSVPSSGPLSKKFLSVWSVPVVSGGRSLLGCLTVLHRFSRPPEPEELLSLETAASLAALALDQHKLHFDLHHVAKYDSLTQLPNRNLLDERLETAMSEARNQGHRVGLLHLDLDHFKLINDQYGYRRADSLLQAVAARLAAQIGNGAFLARLGGDEFGILLPQIHREGEAIELAARIVKLVAHSSPPADRERDPEVTASIGIAIYPDDASDPAGLQTQADAAMSIAKARGRNSYQRYQPNQVAQLRNRIGMERRLRLALEQGEFQLYYQPQVDAQSRLCGFEALVRWNHPQEGLLSPASFIPVAEQSGLIVPIGEWIIAEAARQLALWCKQNKVPAPVSVNVSALQLQGAWLPGLVAQELRNSDVPAECLVIELTESIVMANSEEATRQLKAFRQLGMKVAIDDFGTGYSSLSYLQHLPVDMLKIDRSFVQSLGNNDEKANAVVRAIIALARAFQLRVTAEGVETREQHRELRELGVDNFQGYLFGKPMPAARVDFLLSNPDHFLPS